MSSPHDLSLPFTNRQPFTLPRSGLVQRLVRPIGQGGFGTVWLCWSDASRGYHALKWVAGDAAGLKLELDALRKFREISQKLRSPNLIAIEHINLLPCGLIYTLPLADGMEGNDPAVESWRPMTLADRIERKSGFSSAEILQIILPIIKATAALNGEGLVHRDIKPANILFFGGVPCLADMGLLANDSASLTQRGTPGFLPPSWYLESSGQPDMWGLATTLYTLLTGNNPDKMGRPKFLWPLAGKDSLSPRQGKAGVVAVVAFTTDSRRTRQRTVSHRSDRQCRKLCARFCQRAQARPQVEAVLLPASVQTCQSIFL